jgi:hypothetical protein
MADLIPAVVCTALNSNVAFSAAASSRVLKFLRMRTPCSHPVTRQDVAPHRFSNRLTSNLSGFMLRLPRQLAT